MVGDETYSISRKKACDVFNGTPVGRAVDFRFWPRLAYASADGAAFIPAAFEQRRWRLSRFER